MNALIINYDIFENIKHVDKYSIECWLARELQVVLEYKEWESLKM